MTSSLKFDSFSLQFSHQLTSKHTFCAASHEKFIIFSLFLKGTGSAGVPGLAGSCHRAALEERSCPGVTQCPEHALPPFPSPSISPQRVCFISRQTKPLEKHKATWGLKSQLCQYTHTHGMWQYFIAHLVGGRAERAARGFPGLAVGSTGCSALNS